MKSIIDIRLIDLALGFLILVIPVLFFIYYRVRIVKDVLISVGRMILQLFLVALYLEWIFDKNSAWINILWVTIMVFVEGAAKITLSFPKKAVPKSDSFVLISRFLME